MQYERVRRYKQCKCVYASYVSLCVCATVWYVPLCVRCVCATVWYAWVRYERAAQYSTCVCHNELP